MKALLKRAGTEGRTERRMESAYKGGGEQLSPTNESEPSGTRWMHSVITDANRQRLRFAAAGCRNHPIACRSITSTCIVRTPFGSPHFIP